MKLTWLNIFNLLKNKIALTFIRIIDIIRLFPIRLFRLFQHLKKGGQAWLLTPNIDSHHYQLLQHWFIESFFLILDIFGISEVYETFLDVFKFNTRPLTTFEKKLAQSVFGDTLHYYRIRIDEYAYAGPKQGHFCYVSFHTINSWGTMNNSIFLHELVHVWQYEKMGAVYIPRALRAQYSKEGYNYGGVKALKKALAEGKGLLSFNLEQQADIISDYYRIREGYLPRWGAGQIMDLWIYKKFVEELKT